MQDDVVDGLLWLRKEGIADANRACFVGLSSGGYSALAAAYKTPALIRCAISYAGITDLDVFVGNRGGYRLNGDTMAYLNLLLDSTRLIENSPAQHANHFGVPVLLMQAENDTNVLVEQSRLMAERLQAANKPFAYFEQTDGDHFQTVQKNRSQFLIELERFLAAHLSVPDVT